MFARDKNESRRFFREAWLKFRAGQVLQPLEVLVTDVIAAHPEFHAQVLAASELAPADADPACNPFLHLGLHIALREQLAAERPPGLRAEFARLQSDGRAGHAAEHLVMDALATVLWEAQARAAVPDEAVYMARVRALR
jgi:hypothetical protein